MDPTHPPSNPLSPVAAPAAFPLPSPEASGAQAVGLLLSKLSALHDPRLQGQVLHALPDVLLTALFALISGADDYVDMATFAQTQLAWLRLYVPLINGEPSHDTFRNVFMMLKPSALLEITAAWVGELAGQHVRIDGKVNRGVKDPETGRHCLHLLRAWVGESGLSVGQAVCADKTNELTTLPGLLASLELKSAIISIDAMAGHPEIAQQIHTAGGDWILALKANEKETLQTVAQHFQHLCGQSAHLPANFPPAKTLHARELAPIQWPQQCEVARSEERNRGRYEAREVVVVPLGEWFAKGFLWYGLQSIICVIRTTMRQRHTSDIPVQEVHYYLSSLPPEAAKLGAYIRAHWGIENTCHHLLDVTYHEDHCQVRDRTAAHNLTLMREMATKLLKAHPGKSSVKARRKRAGFSPLFRSEIVDPIFHIPHA